MKNKLNHNNVLITLFCAFIGVFCFLFFVLPKQYFSVNEKRVLEKEPQFSFSALTDGSFGKSVESYLSDHFAARNFFVGLNSYYNLAVGRNGASGIYSGQDGYLIEKPVEQCGDALDRNIAAIQNFAKKTGIKPDMMVVPSTGYVESGKLPSVHEPYNDGEILANAQKRLQGSVNYIDLAAPLKENAGKFELYYKTDHHWTSRGAYLAYQTYCANAGLTAVPLDRFVKETADGFYGTTYSRSALWLSSPDTIEMYKDPAGSFSVEIADGNKRSDSLFFKNHLTEPDKYPVFLDGNHSLVKITNKNAKGGKLLLIKDSYAHPFAPFAAENFSEIYMVDLRYYKSSLSKLIQENSIDKVLILYGIENFVTDTNLVFLK